MGITNMDIFIDALLSGKTDKIPDEYDWFAPLLGDWDCDYYDEYGGQKRYVKGEWIFRRVLEGAGVQDVFIFPSRETKEKEPQPDGEYGSSFRMFNKSEKCYDVCYTCDHCMKRLRFTKEGDKLVGKVLDDEEEMLQAGKEFLRKRGQKARFSFIADRGTSYGAYLHMQELLMRVYADVRNEKALEQFGKPLSGLSTEEINQVYYQIPLNISEAAPKHEN